MLHALRKARLTELALALASVLTLLSSVGLHPEPSIVGADTSVAGWNIAGKVTAGAHDCPICLVHRTCSLNDLSVVVLAPSSSVSAAICPDESRPEKSTPSPHEGRAPPSA